MMKHWLRPAWTAMLGLAVLVSGCGENEGPDELTRSTGAADDEQMLALLDAGSGAAETAPEGAAAGEDAGETYEIYYDLTDFDWYRQGEPLAYEGRGYQPRGIPQARPGESFEAVGEYGGVRFYVPEGAQPPYDVVYIPVFRNYWQPFVAQQDAPLYAD